MAKRKPSRRTTRKAGDRKSSGGAKRPRKVGARRLPARTSSAREAKRDQSEIRLNKFLADCGVASRRGCDELIAEGKVMVDEVPVTALGTKVDPSTQKVEVGGRVFGADNTARQYYLLNTPTGVVCTNEKRETRPRAIDLITDKQKGRIYTVGRLDEDSTGLVLLTNDGELAHALTHPSREVPKRYLVKVYRTPDASDLKSIESGVYLDDGRTLPAKVRVVEQTGATNAWVEITVTEGRNRLIRRIFEQLKHPVAKLRRESFATLSIRGMERGDVRVLTGEELRRVRDIAQGMRPERAGKLRRKKGFAKPKPKPNAKPKSRSRSAAKNASAGKKKFTGKSGAGKARRSSTDKRNKRKST